MGGGASEHFLSFLSFFLYFPTSTILSGRPGETLTMTSKLGLGEPLGQNIEIYMVGGREATEGYIYQFYLK